MTATTRPATPPDQQSPDSPTAPVPGHSRRLTLASCGTVLAALALVTLGPSSLVADVRSPVVSGLAAILGLETVHRAAVENAANALLFVPVGAMAAVALGRRRGLLALLVGAGLSVSLELCQSVLPGRVPDPVDVAANTVGTALGVAVVALASRRAARPGPGRLRVGLLAVPVLVALVACQAAGGGGAPSVPAAAPTYAAPTHAAPEPAAPTHAAPSRAQATDPPEPGAARSDGAATLTAADGFVPRGETLSPSDDVPAITRLDPALHRAVLDAALDARADGVDVRITSGWRSTAYQRALFAEAVAEHGSAQAARRLVLPPERSAHVSGRAVDVGPTGAASWVSRHGSDYGLCQIYANELWHYELKVDRGGACPAMLRDASEG